MKPTFLSPKMARKRDYEQAFDESPLSVDPNSLKRTKLDIGCVFVDSKHSSVIINSSESTNKELIDLCSNSSGSYKTAPDDNPGNLNFLSHISIPSSSALDLTNTKKRLETITLSSGAGEIVPLIPAKLPPMVCTNQRSKLSRKRTVISLNLQIVCLLGTGGYGKVFLVRSQDDLSKNDKWRDDSLEAGLQLKPFERRRGAPRGRPKKVQYIRNTGLEVNEPFRPSRDNMNYYALKVIKKNAVLKSATDLRHLKMEQRILSKIQHPFIVDCYLSAQTEKQLFFISEYIQGGELFNLLDRFAPLDESDSLFYMAEILVAIKYLHAHGIIYRDLKPENVMLTRKGHIKLIDFGLSRDDFPAVCGEVSTATKCGTKEYMAPEVFKKEKYGFSADWWSYGAVSFDIMTNKVPINNQEYSKKIPFPTSMSNVAKDLLQRLMTIDQQYRLGSIQGACVIARHPFFNGINWDDVEKQKLTPPFILTGAPDHGDYSCFSRKVTSEKRRVCSDAGKNAVASELQYHFDNFDFVEGCELDTM